MTDPTPITDLLLEEDLDDPYDRACPECPDPKKCDRYDECEFDPPVETHGWLAGENVS